MLKLLVNMNVFFKYCMHIILPVCHTFCFLFPLHFLYIILLFYLLLSRLVLVYNINLR